MANTGAVPLIDKMRKLLAIQGNTASLKVNETLQPTVQVGRATGRFENTSGKDANGGNGVIDIVVPAGERWRVVAIGAKVELLAVTGSRSELLTSSAIRRTQLGAAAPMTWGFVDSTDSKDGALAVIPATDWILEEGDVVELLRVSGAASAYLTVVYERVDGS